MRERLIELFKSFMFKCFTTCDNRIKYHSKNIIEHNCNNCRYEQLADYLLENGVIVPPCKVGGTVYVIMETSCEDIDGVYTTCEFYDLKVENLCTLPKGKCPYRYRIAKCLVTDSNPLMFTAKWNKTVFPTRAEAEQALKGGEQE